jgi:sulfite oxidase
LNDKNKKIHAQTIETFEAGKLKQELPTFTMNQVKEHNSLEKGVWIVYKNGVYDITKFIESHPGGSEKIILAAGASIEPFWSIYAVHHKNEVYEILEELRIGNLCEKDIEAQKEANKASANSNDAFQNEPTRHPLLKIVSQKPFNAETPSQLNDSLVTPNELHFKRNHLPVPKINIEDFKLEISSVLDNGNSKTLTIEDLKTKFNIYTIPGKS